MKVIKVFIGCACLLVALLFGTVLFLSSELPASMPFALSSCWLAGIGWFLIRRRNLPLLKRGRIYFIFNLALCITFLVFVGIPSLVRPYATSSVNACVNNLRQIDAAVNQFALENHLTNGSPINFPSDLTPYIKLNSAGKIPSCPQGGIYHISKVGETPTCSLGTTVTPAHVEP
jgi:hypothetical protein